MVSLHHLRSEEIYRSIFGPGVVWIAVRTIVEKAKVDDTLNALRAELEQLDNALARHDEDVAKLQTKLAEAQIQSLTQFRTAQMAREGRSAE